MILTEAKRRAQWEFKEALERTGLTLDAVHDYAKRHPELRRAGYKVPHKGYSGSAANYVLHLAEDRKLAEA
jgi:hypothetical protein